MLKEEWLKTVVIILFIIAVIILIFLLLKSDITGRVISFEKEKFLVGEPIQGSLNLKLKEGELIPSSTRVIITLGNYMKELSLKEFVEAAGLEAEAEEQQGKFYLENKELKGEGFGYGFAGHYIVYPDVYFHLKITSVEENITNITLTNVINITEENLTEENETEGNETKNITEIPPLTTLDENETEENETGEIVEIGEVSGEIPVEESPPEEIPAEEQLPAEEIPTEEIPTEEQPTGEQSTEELTEEEQPPAEEQPETPSEENPNSPTENPITGLITFWFRALGIWNSFAILEENSEFKIIEASCSSGEPFTYDLAENEQAELVQGSVKSDGKQLDDSEVNIDIKDNKVEVTTNYFESFEGFGESYLGDEKDINFDLNALGLNSKEPGIYDLEIKFIYQGQEILEESHEIEIIPAIVTIKVVDKDGNVQDIVDVNNTGVTVKIGKIKLKGKEKANLEIENENVLEESGNAVTGGAIIEQQPLPESEINFILMPEDITIQIDKAPEYATEVFAIEPSSEIEIESATITLEKTTAQEITRILQCDDWNVEEFECNGEWQDSGLTFVDNGTHVSFNTTHFTAYVGSGNMTCPYYMNESVVLVDSVQCNGTAFIVNASDIFLDCQGNSINYSITTSGYGVNNSGGFDNVTIRNCVITGTYDSAIYLGGNEQDILIENNVLTVFTDWVSPIYQGGNVTNLTIMDNTLTGTTHALDLREPHNSLIYNNTLYGSVYIEKGSDNTFEENFFDGDAYHFFRGNYNNIINNEFYSGSIEVEGSCHTFFAHNYIEDSVAEWGGCALYFRGSTEQNNTIFNNTIVTYDEGGRGLRIEYNNLSNISYNNITTDCDNIFGTDCDGIYYEYPRQTAIEHNTITTYGDDSNGFYMDYPSNDFKSINDNVITTYGIGSNGIYLDYTETWEGTCNVFRDNVIETDNAYGFYIYNDCTSPGSGGGYASDIDTSNTVEGKPVYYYCDESNNVIEDLDAGQIIVGNTDTWPNGANLTLRNVSSEDGIMLIDDVWDVQIENSVIDTNNQSNVAGITSGTSNNITNVQFFDNYYGVYSHGGNNIWNNNFSQNELGITIEGDSDNINLNNFSDNRIGILVRSSSNAQIFSNEFYSNYISVLLNSTPGGGGGGSWHNVSFNNISGGNYGIYLSDEDNCNVEGNTFDSVDYAIYFYGTFAEVTGNNLYVNNIITSSGTADFYTMMMDSRGLGDDIITNLTTDSVTSSFTAENLSIKSTTSPAPNPSGWQNIGKFLDINNNTENSWILLTMHYNDSELGTINESTLKIWKYNGSWSEVDSTVDEINNMVYMNNPEPPSSVYAPLGQGGGDDEAPQYSQDDDNSGGSVTQGTNVNVYVYWEDDTELDIMVFRNNDSGTWTNVSVCDMSGASGWCNATIATAGDAGKMICWNQWANDSSDNWNTTMSDVEHCFRVRTSGGGPGGPSAYCGDGTCDSDENCTTCPEDCHSCGDGCCDPDYMESYSNCYQDCCYPEGVTRPVLPLHVCCPELNTVIPFDMNCVARQGCSGCEAIGSVTCVRCGNGICGPGENFCNCPQDCPMQNITNCSQLPKLNAIISWLESSQEVKLSWQTSYELLKTSIMAADMVQGQDNLSNFSLKQQLGPGQNSWQEAVPERLKFFQVIAKVKIGEGDCKPECHFRPECAPPHHCYDEDYAWYDSCTDERFKIDNCVAREPQCCFTDTRSEGWYNVNCAIANPDVNLIRYGECEPGEYALACNQTSDVFVKFTQPLVYNENGTSGKNTNINWIVMMPISGWTINDTKELFSSGSPIDYIARWDAARQLQYGSAQGDTGYGGSFRELWEHADELLPGQYLDWGMLQGQGQSTSNSVGTAWNTGTGSGDWIFGEGEVGGGGSREIVITGPFNLTRGYPYFISATMDWDRWTWVGRVPERITFNFKYGPSSSSHENYIVLPFDTTIKKASQLCKQDISGIPITQGKTIVEWDPVQQKEVGAGTGETCFNILQDPENDFALEPGKVYEIIVDEDVDYWRQI